MPPDLVHALLRELVARDHGAWITCGGASMRPTIAPGDRLRVVACERARVGDVVLFEAGADVVAHRVLARVPAPGAAWIVHGGDASARATGFVREDRVIGRVLAARRVPPLRRRVAAAAAALARLVWARIATRRP